MNGMPRRIASASLLAVLVVGLGAAPGCGRQVDESDDRSGGDASPVKVISKHDYLDADYYLRDGMNRSLAHAWMGSPKVAEFFASATIESLKPHLGSKQLLQHAARYATDPEIVAYLIEYGFDARQAFGPGVPEYPQDLGEPLREGPLHFAARYNPNPRIAEMLIEHGADVNAMAGLNLRTPLHYAAGSNNAAVVSVLLKHGARPDQMNGRISSFFHRGPNINGNTPMHRAACNSDAVIDLLVDAGAAVDPPNGSGLTPLLLAARRGCTDSVLALVRHGADPTAVVGLVGDEDEMHDCTGCNAIHLFVDILASQEELEMARVAAVLDTLVELGVDINALIDEPGMYAGYSALRLAIESGTDAAVAALLIGDGAEPDTESLHAVFAERHQYSGRSAGASSGRAVGSANNLEILELLIATGAGVNARDFCGWTVLHRAAFLAHRAESGIDQAAKMLIDAGADVNARQGHLDIVDQDVCEQGLTPLHAVAPWGGYDGTAEAIATMLLGAGADRSIRDDSGDTPYDVARGERMRELLRVE